MNLSKLKYLLFLVLIVSLGCEKEKNAPAGVYEWSATIDGVNYSYSTNGPNYPGVNGGASHATPSSILSSILLQDDGGIGNPGFAINLPSFNVGTYLCNLNSASTTNSSFSYSQSVSSVYNSITPLGQVTVNITRSGSSGGTLEGTFTGTVGKITVGTGLYTYVTITNGRFKAYIQ